MKGISFSTIIFILATLAADNSRADEDNKFVQLVNQHQAALVTVKYVLTLNMGKAGGGKEIEAESEQTCSMISADGLVICSNNQLTGFVGMMKRISKPGDDEMSAIPSAMKVLVGEPNQSYDAEIVARDTELDMVWVQVSNSGETTFPFIDFSDGTEKGIGESVLLIRRMGNNFGRTPVISRMLISGISDKPRTLYIPDVSLQNRLGLPVFSEDGRPVGLVVTQLPETGASANSGNGMFFGSAAVNLQDGMSGMILPASDVVRATRRAIETMNSQQ